MKKISLALLFSINFPLSGISQPLPKPLQSLAEKGDHLVKKSELDETQTQYLWKNTVSDRRGYINVDVSPEYVDLITDFSSMPGIRKTVSAELSETIDEITPLGYHFYGILQEDLTRTTSFFKNDASRMIMFTKWNYRSAGATITIVDEFINYYVNEFPSVLALATSKNSNKGIWKLSSWRNGVAYELYVSDNIDTYGIPRLSAEEILSIGKIFMK